MGLLFCCPSCGANLRVNPATVAVVSCPGCGEAVRVPTRPHPVETAPPAPTFSSSSAQSARSGLLHLLVSSYLFATAGVIALAVFTLRLATYTQPNAPAPDWLPAVLVTLTTVWATIALVGCWFRTQGYSGCRSAAAAVGVEPWARAAVAGSAMTAVGVLAVCPWLLGRSVGVLPTEGVAVVFIGLVCGGMGVALEFAFLTVLHRLLWETAGWQAANRTGAYTVDFVFASVAAMGSVCLGGMVVILAFGGHAGRELNTPPPPLPTEVKWVAAAVLVVLSGCAAWALWRYTRLLVTTLRALTQPEPHPGPPVPTKKT